MSTFLGAKAARNLLFQLDHADISFRLVVVKRHLKIVDKSQHLPFIAAKTIQQVLGWTLFDPSPLLGSSWVWLWQRIGLQSQGDQVIVACFKASDLLRKQV